MDQSKQTEAVFKSSRTEVDPVSGNEVPPGAIAEEVRDDVPAMLSEGEYVVPADVLRFYGVKFFEDLRTEAKQGLAGMESEGRIGGDPVDTDDLPFDPSELSVVDDGQDEMPMMNKGGLIKGYAEGGTVEDTTSMVVPDFLKGYTSGQTDGYRTFQNKDGMIITVRFVNGEPTGYIPPGYEEQKTASEQVAEKVEEVVKKPEPEGRDAPDDTPSVDYSAMTDAELEAAAKGTKTMGLISMALPGPVGILAGLASKHQSSVIAKEMEVRGMIEPEDTEENKGLLSTITDGIKGLFGGEDDATATGTQGTDTLGVTTSPASAAQVSAEAEMGLDPFGGSEGPSYGGDTAPSADAPGVSASPSSNGVSAGAASSAAAGSGHEGNADPSMGGSMLNKGGLVKKRTKKK